MSIISVWHAPSTYGCTRDILAEKMEFMKIRIMLYPIYYFFFVLLLFSFFSSWFIDDNYYYIDFLLMKILILFRSK